MVDLEPKEGRKSKTSTILTFDFFFFFHRENCSETAAEKFRAELKPESQQSWNEAATGSEQLQQLAN